MTFVFVLRSFPFSRGAGDEEEERRSFFFFFFPMCLLARLRERLLVLLLLRQLPPTYIPFISSLVLFLLFSSWPCGRPPPCACQNKKEK